MYNSTGEKARFGAIPISKVREVMQRMKDGSALSPLAAAGSSEPKSRSGQRQGGEVDADDEYEGGHGDDDGEKEDGSEVERGR